MIYRHERARSVWATSRSRIMRWDRRHQVRLAVRTRMTNRYFNLALARLAENWN